MIENSSVICDETTDESDLEQLCFTIRSVDSDFIIHEDVIGMYAVASQTAENITEVIFDILIRCNLDIKYCRGQGYDEASSMSGNMSGVSARIKSVCPKAFDVHLLFRLLLILLETIKHFYSVLHHLSLSEKPLAFAYKKNILIRRRYWFGCEI